MNSIMKKLVVFICLIILSYIPFIVNSTIGFLLTALLFFYLTLKLLKLISINGFHELGLYRHRKWGSFLISGVLIGCFFNGVVFVILSVLDIASLEFVSVQNIILIFLFALFTAGFTAFAEELIFRGYIVKILKEHLSWRWIVLIICFLFTLYHLPQWGLPLPYWIRYFIMAVVFTLPFIVTKSLWLSIGIHFGGNFTYYLLLTELGFLATEKNENIIETMGWVSLGVAFVLLCFIYVFLQKVKHHVHK
ncbi:type II CAAX endopeptidase family protein [Alkalihalobacillus sp. LMS39]|uniref:CPBP family intramembrane glutamic endopeptidase n=1 Tax=Alkalihalobacillus sp. LMS39 TaxID=2924032 RepID=UPI001FB42AAD|nr:type II CAAX endopeptidase family protein [Alkalihalobacillus sp. LMS39]UOE94805.1 CPBP family intramembrane metalloprotease [Alkalihalobacillus sp. LMS39]